MSPILKPIRERVPAAGNRAVPPAAPPPGGFPIVQQQRPLRSRNPPPRKERSCDLLDNQTAEANARLVAAMSAEEIEDNLRDIRSVIGESTLEWLRHRRCRDTKPNTPPSNLKELEEAVREELPKSEKSKLAVWEKKPDDLDGLIELSRSRVPAQRRYAMMMLRSLQRPSRVAIGLAAAGLQFRLLDDDDVDRARQIDKYALENARDALSALRAMEVALPNLPADAWQSLGTVIFSTAKRVTEEMRSWAIGLALQDMTADRACWFPRLDNNGKALELLRSRRPDFEELCLEVWRCRNPSNKGAPPADFFRDSALSPRFVVRAAAQRSDLTEIAATCVQDVPADELGLALLGESPSSDPVRASRLSVVERCSRAVALRIWRALERDDSSSLIQCPNFVLEDDYGTDFEAATAALELLLAAASDRSIPRTLREVVDRAEDAWTAPKLHELAAQLFVDDSRYLFALATLDAASCKDGLPEVAKLACAFAARCDFVAKSHFDKLKAAELPPPRAWLLAPIINGSERCLRALERGNRYTDKLPPGVVFAHVAHAPLFGLDTALLDDLAPRSNARDIRRAFEIIDAYRSNTSHPVAAFAGEVTKKFLQTGTGPIARLLANLVRPNMPSIARKEVWHHLAGLLRLIPIPKDDVSSWLFTKPNSDDSLSDDLALALANDPLDLPLTPAHHVAINHLAAALAASGEDHLDFQRRTKFDFFQKHARNPELLLASLQSSIARFFDPSIR